jgi:hypothetical protein
VVVKTTQKMTRDIAVHRRGMGLLHEFQHIDYADPTQDPIGVCGEGNVEYLGEATREYDPVLAKASS